MSISDRDISILEHIVSHCNKIQASIERFGNNFGSFVNDSDFIDSVSMNLLQIGELSGKLSAEYVSKTSDSMSWRSIKCMRNMFAHDYGSMDIERIWETAIEDIPQLKSFCENELSFDTNFDIEDGPTMSM